MFHIQKSIHAKTLQQKRYFEEKQIKDETFIQTVENEKVFFLLFCSLAATGGKNDFEIYIEMQQTFSMKLHSDSKAIFPFSLLLLHWSTSRWDFEEDDAFYQAMTENDEVTRVVVEDKTKAVAAANKKAEQEMHHGNKTSIISFPDKMVWITQGFYFQQQATG